MGETKRLAQKDETAPKFRRTPQEAVNRTRILRAQRILKDWGETPVRLALRKSERKRLLAMIEAAADCSGAALDPSGTKQTLPGDPTAMRVLRREELARDYEERLAAIACSVAELEKRAFLVGRLLTFLPPADEVMLTAIYRDRLTVTAAAAEAGLSRSSAFRLKRAAELRFALLLEQREEAFAEKPQTE